MNLEQQDEPGKLTKVLIKNIHGGRKEDSKFWQSEFADQQDDINIDIPRPTKTTFFRNRFLLPASTILLLIALAYAAVFLKPDLFPFLDRHNIHAYISKIFPHNWGKAPAPKPIAPMPSPQMTAPYIPPVQTAPPTKIEKYTYIVEFRSGKTMEAKNVSMDDNIVTLFIDKGYTVKMSKSDIRSVKREKL